MKFAFVSTMVGAPWGGSEVLWSSTCRQLASDGHKVAVAYPKRPILPKTLQEIEKDFSLKVLECSNQLSLTQKIANVVRRKLNTYLPMKKERDWLKNFSPDLLCISSGNATEGAAWMKLAVEENINYVTIAQAHAEFLWPSDQDAVTLAGLFSQAKRCFFVSHGNLSLVETQLGTSLSNSEVISNHSAAFGEANTPWPANDDGLWRLACVGRLHPASKGQDILFEVLSQPHWRTRPILISLYGEGPQEKCLKSLVARDKLQGLVRFCGHVSDVEEIWRNNHALVLPSRYEGLPLALVEALMCARMAIVTDVAGNSEVVQHGITGFIAEAPAVKSMARALEEAWEARNSWKEMGLKAQTSIRQQLPRDPSSILAKKLIELASY